MNRFIGFMDVWLNKAIRFVEAGRNILTTRDSGKEKTTDVVKEAPEEAMEEKWEEEIMIGPDSYFVTQTGHMMRDPVKRKIHYKRYKVKK